MAGPTLRHWVCFFKSVDPHFMDQEKLFLTSAFFLSHWPFHGQAKPVDPRFKDSSQKFSLQKSIKAMATVSTLAKSTTLHTQLKPFLTGQGFSRPPQRKETGLKGSQVLQCTGCVPLTYQQHSFQLEQAAPCSCQRTKL